MCQSITFKLEFPKIQWGNYFQNNLSGDKCPHWALLRSAGHLYLNGFSWLYGSLGERLSFKE